MHINYKPLRLFGRLFPGEQRCADPLSRLSLRELADLPPWHEDASPAAQTGLDHRLPSGKSARRRPKAAGFCPECV